MSSSSSLASLCSCSGTLCFCELTSPVVVVTPSQLLLTKKVKITTPHEEKNIIVPGCLCFRCEAIREEVYTLCGGDDEYEDDEDFDYFDGFDFNEEDLQEEEFEVDEPINIVVGSEEAKETFLITSLC